MKTSKEVAKELNLNFRTVKSRAEKLGFKRKKTYWYFTKKQIQQIKDYSPIKQFQSKFYFSDDGQYLIINSRMNDYERLFN